MAPLAVFNTSQVLSGLGTLPGLLSDSMHWRLLSVILGLDITAGAFATGANVVTILVYSKMGFADSTNISLTALAISDLGIAITTVTCVIGNVLATMPNVSFTTDIFLTTAAYPHTFLARISALITTHISIERYLCVLLPLKIKRIITPTRTLIIMIVFFVATFAFYPIAFIRYPLRWVFYADLNRTLLSVNPDSGTTALRLNNTLVLIMSIIIPFLTFFIVVVCTILLSLSLQRSRAWRDVNKSASTNTAGRTEKEARAVKMVITIAVVFIVATIPSCMHTVATTVVPGFSISGRYANLFDITWMSFFGVNSINSGANVIIYYRMSNKFRQAMLRFLPRKTGRYRDSGKSMSVKQ